MKKKRLATGAILAAVLVLTSVRADVVLASGSHHPAPPDLWAKNVALCLTNPSASSDAQFSSAYWEGDNFKWVLARCDLDGTPREFFMDGFLFLAYNFGKRSLFPLASNQPGTCEDWDGALELYLDSAQHLSRCEAEVTRALGQPNRKAKVILTVPYPDARNHAFGPIDGKRLDLGIEANREAAVRWFIDKALSRWAELAAENKLEHVRLAGFYWSWEGIDNNFPAKGTDDPALVRAFCAYVHQQGLLAHWIPQLAVAKHPQPWRQWGLDCFTQQINYINADERGRSLVTFDDCTQVARIMGMDGVQINFSNRTSELNPRLWNWRQQALANLEAALRLNWKSFPCLSYFDANEIVAIGRDPKARDYYEALGRWVDGTLTYKEVDAMCDRLAKEMHAAGQLGDTTFNRIKATNQLIVLIPAREKLSLMEKPLEERHGRSPPPVPGSASSASPSSRPADALDSTAPRNSPTPSQPKPPSDRSRPSAATPSLSGGALPATAG